MTLSMNLFQNQRYKGQDPLAEAVYSIARYIPVFWLLASLGFLVIFLLAQTRILGDPAWQLLALSGTGIFAAASHLIVIHIANRNHGTASYLLYVAAATVTGVLLVLLWNGIVAGAIILVWLPLLSLMTSKRPGHLITVPAVINILFNLLASLLLFWTNIRFANGRLDQNNLAGVTALIFLAGGAVLFSINISASGIIRYRTLRSRLITSFVLIITASVFLTTLVSAVTAFRNSQNQFRDTLRSISSLKEDQINTRVQQPFDALGLIQQGTNGGANIQYVLEHNGDSDDLFRLNTSLAATSMRDFVVTQYREFRKFVVLDNQGVIILSTIPVEVGQSLANQEFFQQGMQGQYAGLAQLPDQPNAGTPYELTIAEPMYSTDGQTTVGVLVLVGDTTYIDQIMGTTAGLPDAETYLVNRDLVPVTQTKFPTGSIAAVPIANMIHTQMGEGSALYSNYAGTPVLGYYQWYSTLHAGLVAEIPQSQIFSKAVSSLVASGFVGIFVIAIAIIAVLATARTISDPVVALADTAGRFAAGDLNVRAVNTQQDEIGNLTRSFNSMADQLREIIGNLEQRIAERTQGLEQQTLRLRTAAEVARDAASAPNIDELLNRAARLIRDRFDLYHTGIFLIDEKKENAVLYASPTEAGRQMLTNRHHLRVGEEGIVGRVAATGEPRIALDTGVDPAYFSNPYLPNTHSEMALPLKSNEGVIGILDIQSDQPEAFTQDDIAIMQVMADQLSTAIEKTRLLHQIQSSLIELERTYGGMTRQSWKILERSGQQVPGYRFDNIRLEAIQTIPSEAKQALEQSAITTEESMISTARSSMAIPIRLRGQTIGAIHVRLQGQDGTKGTITMIEQIADRLATALENARLLEDSLRRANKERVIGEITSRISASTNMRNVLQTAVEELGRALPGSDVTIQIQPSRDDGHEEAMQ